MITHFSELKLQTVSIQGVEQVYAKRLGIPVLSKTDKQISFQLTPHVTLFFEEVYEPISPAHVAFQVPFSKFYETAKWVQESGLLIIEWEDGHEIDEEDGRLNLYFRDGDGNLLEIIAHNYIIEEVLIPCTPLNILYVREVGCPVKSVPIFREWLKSNLSMKTFEDGEIFNFVVSGTAHIVASWKGRTWIPIAMKALPPKIHISLGTPSLHFIQKVRNQLRQNEVPCQFSKNEISLVQEGYSFSIQHTPHFKAEIPNKLNLPLSI
ncbi:glyoxalase/bleomycin resistance/dioxygenase family protein [Bacillus sp. Xin]|uniref:VOC family protein n=1 Tax=unclassified Bacillus (in: firmicutes) TaxID=185979 RepID=UPI00157371D7|nr:MULTISPECIES: glyoxalase/bleomycin resistance/dioxygenase family protein [unclassified Bacillus (in: firmicutes)]MBC6972925.1 glyoxalase/bleomycin resistance/dioxygenase family protein [Bacillus sp. Xin]NSW36506.1 glyoxalase/bleomycin resistance/dioxygenase family protein [Bacillus sp. Xin1]